MQASHKFRTIITFGHYFEDFLVKQTTHVKSKIIWTFLLIEEVENVPTLYLKKIINTEGLYEIRIKVGSNIFRIFCFFDVDKLVVLANGFQKKTQKIPKAEITKAIRIKIKYENEKEH